MKKLLLALPVILLLAAGCNSSQPTTEQTQPVQQTQTTPTQQQQVAQNPAPQPTPTLDPTQKSTPTSPPQGKTYTDTRIQGDSGTIEGSLSYPSEYIPDNMMVCAQNQSSGDQYCTTKHLSGDKYLYKVGYKIQVLPGQYLVYAQLPDRNNLRAYYDEAVTCGLNAHCSSTKPIIIDVMTNQPLQEVDPIDWYNTNPK